MTKEKRSTKEHYTVHVERDKEKQKEKKIRKKKREGNERKEKN